MRAVCIASGPSLTSGDCALVHRTTGGRGVVVTNTTFRLCPWADALYGMDNEWWRKYGEEVAETFKGVTYSRYGEYGTRKVKDHGHNSGAGALLLAAELGAKQIIMLGYDCGYTTRKHWHDDHRRPLGNCESMPRWVEQFERAKSLLTDVEVINASRTTALDVFPCQALEDVLCLP